LVPDHRGIEDRPVQPWAARVCDVQVGLVSSQKVRPETVMAADAAAIPNVPGGRTDRLMALLGPRISVAGGRAAHKLGGAPRVHQACDAAGIPRRRFHDLRGTTATLMRDLGVAEDTRMARLGHNTTSMQRRYAKGAESQDRAASQLLMERIANARAS
jgi:integrase